MTNLEFSKQKAYIHTCESLKIELTKRQASKYRNKKGLLFKKLNRISTDFKNMII